MGDRRGGGTSGTPAAAGVQDPHGVSVARVRLVPLLAAGLRSVSLAFVGMAGPALVAAGLWWASSHLAALRLLGSILAASAPLTVLGLYDASGLLGPAVLWMALWALAVVAGYTALSPRPAPTGRHPVRHSTAVSASRSRRVASDTSAAPPGRRRLALMIAAQPARRTASADAAPNRRDRNRASGTGSSRPSGNFSPPGSPNRCHWRTSPRPRA